MEKANKLQKDGSPATSPISRNVRGRPTLQKVIKFSPQPKSIISQMLSKMRSETNTPKSIVRKDVIVISNSPDPDECDQDVMSIEEETKSQKTKLYSCNFPNCKYSCKLSSNLIKHKRVHTNDRPYLCDQCSFRTNFVNSLKVHKRTHTAEKPYPCKYCNYKCNSSSNLKKHCLHRHPEVIKDN